MRRKQIWVILSVLALLAGACVSREERVREARKRFRDVIGCWSLSFIDSSGRTMTPQALRWIDVDETGTLRVRMQAELSGDVMMKVDDRNISFDRGELRFGDEFAGHVAPGAESASMTFTHWDGETHPVLLRKVRDADTLRMLERLYASRVRAFAPLRVQDLHDGIEVTTFSGAEADSLPLTKLLREIHDGYFGDIHALLMMKKGRLFLEEYFGFDGALHGPAVAEFVRSRPHTLQSVSKSILSAVTGIALARGLIPDPATPVGELLPEYAPLLQGGKRAIMMHHLLAMNVGLQWNGLQVPMIDSTNDTRRMYRSADPLAFLFSRPQRLAPGRSFNYNNGCYLAVQRILDSHIAEGTGAFAQRELFGPLGIDTVDWPRDGAPMLTPRDLVRFGLLYLRDGMWNGRPIVPTEWIARSTTNHQYSDQTRYGYFWWLHTFPFRGQTLRCITAIGDGGQYLLLFPRLDVLIVVMAGNYERRIEHLGEKLEKTILPAIAKRNSSS